MGEHLKAQNALGGVQSTDETGRCKKTAGSRKTASSSDTTFGCERI
jgi:hypothetical protein